MTTDYALAPVVELIHAGGEDHRQHDRPCAADPDSFYIDGTSPDARADRLYAKTLCAACPIMDQCLRAALETDEHFGVWGGIDFHWERYLLPAARARLGLPAPMKRSA